MDENKRSNVPNTLLRLQGHIHNPNFISLNSCSRICAHFLLFSTSISSSAGRARKFVMVAILRYYKPCLMERYLIKL